MQTVLKSVLAISVCLASLRLVEADWKTDLEAYVNSLAAGDCKSYMQGDIEKTIKEKTQETACLSVKTSKPLFQAVTKCSGTVHDNLEKIMCKGVTLSVPVTTHWKYRLGSYVIGIQDDSCKKSLIGRIKGKKDQTKTEACGELGFGSFLFALATGCSDNDYNHLEDILCKADPTPITTTTTKTTAATITTTSTAPTITTKAKPASKATTKIETTTPAAKPPLTPAIKLTTKDEQSVRSKTAPTPPPMITSTIPITSVVEKGSKTGTLAKVASTPGTATAATEAPKLADWEKEIEDYAQGLTDQNCKRLLVPVLQSQKGKSKQKACTTLRGFGKSTFTSITKCSEDVYKRLEKIMCEGGSSLKPVTTSSSGDWEQEIQDYALGLTNQDCKKFLVPVLLAQKGTSKGNACKTLHAFDITIFTATSSCAEDVYKRLEKIMCVGGMTSGGSTVEPATTPGKSNPKPVTSPSTSGDWEKEIEDYAQGLTDQNCKGLLVPVLQSQKGKSKQNACTTLHGFGKSTFTSVTKCSEDVYKRLEKIMCEGGSSLKPVTSSCSGDWEKQIQDYTLGLTDQNCKNSLVPVLLAQKGTTKQKACKSLHQFGMKVFSSTTKCSGDVYKRLDKIMCAGGCSIAPVGTKDSWKNRFKAGVEKLKDGTCKSKLLQFMHQPKKQDACTVITAARQVFHAATACPRQMYSRVKAWVCGQDASSVPDSTTNDWKANLLKFVTGLQDKTCQANLIKQIQSAGTQQKRQEACKFIRDRKNVFQTATKCSKEVYDKMETIMCGGGGGTVPKVVATVRGWQTDLNEYVFGLQKSFCRSSLIAQIRMFVERKEEIDPCTYIKKSKPAFAKTTRCSDFVYGRLEDILCIEPPEPKNDTSPRQWKSKLVAYVDKLGTGTCKSSMGVYVDTLTDENQEVHPCKFIKFTRPMIKETTNCSMTVYEDLKEFMCRGSSISLSGYLVVVVCVVRYILLF